jgi:hypothetical protein
MKTFKVNGFEGSTAQTVYNIPEKCFRDIFLKTLVTAATASFDRVAIKTRIYNVLSSWLSGLAAGTPTLSSVIFLLSTV